MADREPLPTAVPLNITRGLTDKLVEKRKGAALELERMVKDYVAKKEFNFIKEIIASLKDDFTLSSNPNSRKGGLVGLAAAAIALGRPNIGMNLPELVQPVLVCFDDQDPRVRYYACESLYNVSKVARGAVLVFFNDIFDGLCKLSCDSDSNVRYGTELLDRLMKDVVSENPHFDMDNFITLLRDRMYTQSTYARQFLVSWIIFLDSVPDIHMHEHVPEFIDGLFKILGDSSPEIKKLTEDALGELLKEIRQHSHAVRYEAMANVIATHCLAEDKVIQLIALRWMNVFLELSGRTMLMFTANILVAVLPCLAYSADRNDIRKVAQCVNEKLKNLIRPSDDDDTSTDISDQIQMNLISGSPMKSTPSVKLEFQPEPIAISDKVEDTSRPRAEANANVNQHSDSHQLSLLNVLGVLVAHMKFTEQETRLETLRWLLWLHKMLPKRIYLQAGKLFPPLKEMLTDISDRVLNLTLQVMATLSMSKAARDQEDVPTSVKKPASKGHVETTGESCQTVTLNKYFRLFLVDLMNMFNSDRILLENKGNLILRHLCVLIDAKAVYCTLAEILSSEEKLSFGALMVRELNTILFSAAELFDLRLELQNMDGQGSWVLFKTLYDCWCHNPIATVALCLLSQNYQHAANIVAKFGDIEITSEVLQETDKLVQLIESPIFTFLRLQLLSPHQYPYLVQTLYGLLMLLPQTAAFESLKNRLSSAPIVSALPHEGKKKFSRQVPRDVDFDKLLHHFLFVQQKHFSSRHTQVQQTIRKILFEATTTTV